jgi:hypothetical protein
MSAQRKFFVIGCGIVGALLGLALLFGVAAYQFKQYGAAIESLPGKATPIMIAIIDPHTGQTVPAGTPLLVHVSASGPEALLSLELWANGQLVGLQASPSANGITPFAADFAWTPTDPGTYTLIARALQADKQSGDSAAVVVIVGPTEKTADEGGDAGQSVPISSGGGGSGGSLPLPMPPVPPGESDSVGPAQPWSLSIPEWLSGAPDGLPQAPELTAEVEGCGAILNIHDLSQNEDGFIVFRMTETSPMLTKIATLEGQSELDWLTFTDESYTHANSYMVRAFKGIKVADSNIVFVDGNPVDCGQNASEPSVFSIQLTSLKTDMDADMAYCYKSLNGMDWSRWPVTGFFTPGADGFEIQDQADSILLNELEGKLLTLDLECWGWAGGVLKLLGKLHKDGIGPGLDDLQLVDGGLIAGLDFGGVIETKGGDPPKPPTGPKMPKVFAILFYGPNACKEHTPSGGDSLLENLLFCTWFPEYNSDQGASQGYLVWYVSSPPYLECLAGKGADCSSFQAYLDRVNQYGGEVGFNVYGQFSDSIPLATTPYNLTAFVVPPQSTCGQDTLFMTVRMYWLAGPNDPDIPNQMRESIDSNTISSIFNCPTPEEVKLDVFFDTLQIGNLGDGVGGGDDLEIYASFAAEGKNPGTGSVLNLGYWGWSGDDCPDDSFVWLGVPNFVTLNSAGISFECPLEVKEGSTSLSEQALCASDTYSHCVGAYSNNNNKVQVTVAGGSLLRVAVHAMDYDENSGDDTVCQTETTLGPQSIFGWEGFTASGQMSQGDNDTASCTVFFHVAPSP